MQGAESLAEYRFGSRRVAHMFCRHCGIKLFGQGDKASFPDASETAQTRLGL